MRDARSSISSLPRRSGHGRAGGNATRHIILGVRTPRGGGRWPGVTRGKAEVQAAEHHAQPALQGTAWLYWHTVPLAGVEIYLRDFEGIYAFPSSGGTVVGANWSMIALHSPA